MRVAVEYRSSSKEVYKKFCELHPGIVISFQDWKDVIYGFNEKLRNHILDTGEKVKIPWGFGSLAISKKKRKKEKTFEGKTYVNLAVDWAATRKAGKYIYHFNAHTGGYNCKWYWFLEEGRFFLSDIWYFKPSRESSREMTQYIKKTDINRIDYYKEWSKGYKKSSR